MLEAAKNLKKGRVLYNIKILYIQYNLKLRYKNVVLFIPQVIVKK